MKINHRVPVRAWHAMPESDSVDDDYTAEVQHSTERGEREFRQAQGRLNRAEQRLARAREQNTKAARKRAQNRLIKKLEALIIERRAELAEIERLMTPAKADRTLMLRTGRDDHLELGIPKQDSLYVPVFAVVTSASETAQSAWASQ